MRIQRKSKPQSADIHFKYICAGCGSEHWVSYKENQTKGYKIVCYMCDVIIEPQIISKISIQYDDVKPIQPQKEIEKPSQPEMSLLEQCIHTLKGYGFSLAEAKEMSSKMIQENPDDDLASIIKKVIFDFGTIK